MHPHNNLRGFTLIEALLSVAMIGLIASFGIPLYFEFQSRNDLDVAAVSVAQSLRRAQTLSQAVDGDEQWGVHVVSGSITVFQGTSYATRDTDFDEVFDVPSGITTSGITDIVFAKFTGVPSSTGSFVFTSPNNETRTITINSAGMVQY